MAAEGSAWSSSALLARRAAASSLAGLLDDHNQANA